MSFETRPPILPVSADTADMLTVVGLWACGLVALPVWLARRVLAGYEGSSLPNTVAAVFVRALARVGR